MSDIVLASDALPGLQSFLPDAESLSALAPELVAELRLPPRPARYADLKRGLHPMLTDALRSFGIEKLYSHQTEAVDSILSGRDTMIVSPTASGKTLCYNLPVVQTILDDPSARALYLFPLKALAQDQLRTLRNLTDSMLPPIESALYDGDTSQIDRKRLQQRLPNVLMTNPDMLHYGILPYHARNWQRFFEDLRIVVLDEVHTYRGLFGAHMAHVLHRLRRVLQHHGSNPVFVLCSATIGNPEELAQTLVGRSAHVIQGTGAPSPGTRLFVMNPVATSLHTMACRLTIACIQAGLKCITFTKARRTTELIYTWIEQQAPELAPRISSYRSGFLPEERREIEQRLFSGELDAVISTSALEVGIDVGGLDACILVGYPGSITATFQRAGRVGRGRREGLVFLLAGADALDQYFVRNPEQILRRGFEPAVVDPTLGNVLKPHLISAAAETPLRNDEPVYQDLPILPAIREMVREGKLELAQTWEGHRLFSPDNYPQKKVDLRGGGDTFNVLDSSKGTERVVGYLSGSRAYAEGHEGAVYLHRGQSYLVDALDLEHKNIHAHPAELPYYTQTLYDKTTEVLEVLRRKPLGNVVASYGKLRVTTTIHSFQKRRVRGQELLSTHPLKLPPQILETLGFWWELDPDLGAELTRGGQHLMGSLHATEHCSIGLMPLFALCDRADLGGICYPQHPQLGKSAIFVYDGHSGGLGLAEKGWHLCEELLRETLRAIGDCDCHDGCPSCIQSPRCGAGNKPLDKAGSIDLIRLMLAEKRIRKPAALKPVQPALPVVAEVIEPPPPPPPPPRIVVVDVETQRSADEVGGWHNTHLMRVAIAVAYDSLEDRYFAFREGELDGLFRLLDQADLVVGFNIAKFDYGVLRAYTNQDLRKLPTLDLLDEIHHAAGRRIGLGDLCLENFQTPKTADGLQSLRWFREGRMQEIIDYCQADVELTWRLFQRGVTEGQVLIPSKGRRKGNAAPVRWKIAELLERVGRKPRQQESPAPQPKRATSSTGGNPWVKPQSEPSASKAGSNPWLKPRPEPEPTRSLPSAASMPRFQPQAQPRYPFPPPASESDPEVTLEEALADLSEHQRAYILDSLKNQPLRDRLKARFAQAPASAPTRTPQPTRPHQPDASIGWPEPLEPVLEDESQIEFSVQFSGGPSSKSRSNRRPPASKATSDQPAPKPPSTRRRASAASSSAGEPLAPLPSGSRRSPAQPAEEAVPDPKPGRTKKLRKRPSTPASSETALHPQPDASHDSPAPQPPADAGHRSRKSRNQPATEKPSSSRGKRAASSPAPASSAPDPHPKPAKKSRTKKPAT